MATTVPTLGHKRVNPSVNFNPVAQIISKAPATNNNVHAIGLGSFLFSVFHHEFHHSTLKNHSPPIPKGEGKIMTEAGYPKIKIAEHVKKHRLE
jgi:hypothetical protein